jgi:hypothetical protein
MSNRILSFAASLLWLPLCAVTSKVAPFSLVSEDVEFESVNDMALSVKDMESVFARSEETRSASMARISAGLTIPKSMEVLQRMTNASNLEDIASFLSGGQISKTSLRHKRQPGYSGIDGARQLLNDMIYESLSKYDADIAKCTDFYSQQCALMEIARGAISAANFVAANSRALILDAQANINRCEVSIPEVKQELKENIIKCKQELQKLNTRLKIVMGDIAVMTMILKMTDCETKLLQMKKLIMLRCHNECTKKRYVSFNHKELQEKVLQLRAPESLDLLQTSFSDMFDKRAPIQSVQLMQVDSAGFQEPMVNKTEFNNPPVPVTKVPGNPCKDPYKGAPSAADKRAAKCTIKKSPQCYKLQSRFLAIQGGIADERDKLLEDISKLEASCEEQKKTLETSIANDEDLLASSNVKLAAATEKESTAGEIARQTAKQNDQYNADLITQMKKCSTNYITFETELCALKKIRGELYKLKGGGHSAFFQDCEVSKWDPEECTKVCAGGEQKLTRNVLSQPKGGTKCLPLVAVASCNNHPCPVDCKLHAWGGWSKCSAKCGGGVTQRLRDVKRAMRYNGKPCGQSSMTKACNAAACEKDCDLSEWTKWTSCSKDCDGGSRKRQKFISAPAEGEGKCPGAWSKPRLEYKGCNRVRCKLPEGKKTLTCNTTMDVILMIDECPKNGEKAFKAQIEAATYLVDAFHGDGITAVPNFAIIKYCGPRTWNGVSKCAGKSTEKVDIEKTCKTKVVQHFDEDLKKTKNTLNGLSFAKGTKLVALALLTAKAELSLGRKTAQSVVIVFTDGAPLSFRKTKLASRSLRKKTRLHWVVTAKFSPLKDIKKWASRRWQENIVKVSKYEKLAKPITVTHVLANICPKKFPKLKTKRDRPPLMLNQK